MLGSLDGKHIRCRRPANSGSAFFNYKGFYSVVLFACVDAEYKFMYVNVGSDGRASDSTIWKNSKFREALESPDNPLCIPAPREIEGNLYSLKMFFYCGMLYISQCYV